MGYLTKKYKPISVKADLKTSVGLTETAKQAGVGERAEKILAKKGEDPKQIFSGGFISDTFDVLNSLQYGVTGLLKGKTFKEGVRTRQSFSDKDSLGKFGLPGTLAGIAADIAVDPLTYIAPWTVLRKIPGIAKAGKATLIALKRTKIGETAGRAFIYRFGQDKVYKEIAERNIRNTAIQNQNLMDIVRPMTKLSSKDQKIIASARKAGKLNELPKDLLERSKPAFDELDRLGGEAVKQGLLDKNIWKEGVGNYMARLYRSKETLGGKIKTFFGVKPKRLDLARFKKRKDIPEEIREIMGEIMEAGYPTAKTLLQLNSVVENAKFFSLIASKWGSKVAKDGFEKLSNTKTLGKLTDNFVPKPIFDDIQEIIKTKTPTEKALGKVVAGFKYGKVILNPATHARNVMSNFILNNFEGLNPGRLDIYASAAKNLVSKGKWYKEAKGVGLGLNTFASREIKDILTGPNGKKLSNSLKTSMDKIADVYQKEEEFAKLAQYIFQRKKGLNPEKAWEIAERATFNYSQVTPFIRKMRESIFGFPFITFTYKVTPQVAKTLVKKPTKISNIGKIKQGIENMSDSEELKRERASEPDWIRDGFYIKLPMKDEHGRSAYFDLTYIMPFGDLMSGQLLERKTKRETGLPESPAESALRKTPLLNVIKELGSNEDFYGNKVFKESDTIAEQLGDLMLYLVRTYSPPLVGDQLPGGYRYDGAKRPPVIQRVKEGQKKAVEGKGFQTRTLKQELLRNIGIKIQPMDVETQEGYSEWEKRKALKTFLEEEGVTKEFSIPYIQK